LEAITPVHGPPRPVHLIAGPTASGKSTLAVRLALEIGGEIVNADSMQIYRDLRVLTARPSPAHEAAARHHLFGVADGATAWSVGHWLRAVGPILDDIAARGRTAIVVGGTGLYFHALTRGLAEAPPVPDVIRAATIDHLAEIGEPAFRAALGAVDPAAEARISKGDGQRLVRALAVFKVTGRSLTDWQAATAPVRISSALAFESVSIVRCAVMVWFRRVGPGNRLKNKKGPRGALCYVTGRGGRLDEAPPSAVTFE
jgi:tRNA dimethylallyltransferase